MMTLKAQKAQLAAMETEMDGYLKEIGYGS